jgi:hypothetical protein
LGGNIGTGTAAMFEPESRIDEGWPRFGTFDECDPGELMRMQIAENRTEWVLKGRLEGPPQMLLVFVLSGARTQNPTSSPYFFEVTNSDALRKQLPVLSYGLHYHFVPDHLGPCDLISGTIFDAVGSLVLSGPERFIGGWFRDAKLYYNINTGLVEQSITEHRRCAAFLRWTLWLDLPDEEKRPIRTVN